MELFKENRYQRFLRIKVAPWRHKHNALGSIVNVASLVTFFGLLALMAVCPSEIGWLPFVAAAVPAFVSYSLYEAEERFAYEADYRFRLLQLSDLERRKVQGLNGWPVDHFVLRSPLD